MSKPVSIDDSSFEQKVLPAKKPTLVDFWAPWCRPCLMVAPILDELSEEYSDQINFFKMDVDQNPKTATKYNVMSIPTLLIFKNGEPVSHVTGFRPKAELKRLLDAALT
ncbi:thioredoxin [Chloroflexota bacterium]